MSYLWFFLLSIFLQLEAKEHQPNFDGILGSPTTSISNCTANADFFIPYNAVILEVGGYQGINTANLAITHPQGQVIVFEPNPRAFKCLLAATEQFNNVMAVNAALNTYNGIAKLNLCHGIYCDNPQLEMLSSLLAEPKNLPQYFKGPVIEVPCVILDDWCKKNQVDHIDFIQLDTEGFELQILKSSPEILKTVLVICTKTNFARFREHTTQYSELKNYLENCGFVMLSHWYREGVQGEATFIRQYIYDALFK